MTAEVFDQFLRRRINQFYFGFFVGLALYALLTLATVNEPFNPVFGGTVAFLLTVVALYLLILLRLEMDGAPDGVAERLGLLTVLRGDLRQRVAERYEGPRLRHRAGRDQPAEDVVGIDDRERPRGARRPSPRRAPSESSS